MWAKVFGELFERLRMPAVLGEILAGVILGPYATRFIIPGDTIYSVAEIGAVFLLFTVGLEISPSDLIRVGRLSLEVAFCRCPVFGYAISMIFVAPEILERLGLGIQPMQTHDVPLVLALALCLGLSVAATWVGMAAIIGAFFAVPKSFSLQWFVRKDVLSSPLPGAI